MPAAIVDRSGIVHDRSSYTSKAPNHFKPYNTRSFNAQATRIIPSSSSFTDSNNEQLKNMKSGLISPSLPLKNSTAHQTYKSLPVEEEVELKNNLNLNPAEDSDVPALDSNPTAADSLYEHDTKHYPSEHFTPKLLTIDMPTVLHESFYDDLKDSFTVAIRSFPYHRLTIRPQIHMNRTLAIKDKSVTPDLVISLSATRGPSEVLLIPYIGVTALTEEWDHVFEKMVSMIAQYPETILASIVLVRELKRYACPAEKSTATETLHNRCNKEEKPDPLSLKSFMRMCSTPRTVEEPVKVADHIWCHVESVEYFVWLKGEKDKPIDLRNSKPEYRAHGTLMPELRMENVTKIFDRGLAEMKDLFVRFQTDLDPAVDRSALEKYVIPSFPIDWSLSALGIATAADFTAHLRYVNWHAVCFRGVKRSRDSSYAPSESEGGSSVSEVDDPKPQPASAGTKKTPPTPSHHAFRTIIVGPRKSDSTVTPVAGTSSKPLKASTSKPSKAAAESTSKPSKGKGKGKGKAKPSNKCAKH
ncbi:hypothetical protein DEU56DRAFT_912111 [Suillus clintonianus]|uniref:uncharacterized protein n=1 Tax=Suillus clintonianus TaxID=1904413 RepID=UPI001B870059|nr:uncharacterized protein DEU56DRAFT_912111 [Suillus clintonianus]KAG2139277.1 hypothetical protein DEU56DRAFT_912111 [Suillus clintonianus]